MQNKASSIIAIFQHLINKDNIVSCKKEDFAIRTNVISNDAFIMTFVNDNEDHDYDAWSSLEANITSSHFSISFLSLFYTEDQSMNNRYQFFVSVSERGLFLLKIKTVL